MQTVASIGFWKACALLRNAVHSVRHGRCVQACARWAARQGCTLDMDRPHEDTSDGLLTWFTATLGAGNARSVNGRVVVAAVRNVSGCPAWQSADVMQFWRQLMF